jgi:hypothetical protein
MIRETSELQPALLLLAPKRIPDLRLFRRNVVMVAVGDRKIRAGIKGQADLYGFWRGGKAIELELKGARTRSTPDQDAWAAFCFDWGVQHLTLRAQKNETVEETTERWCREIETLRQARTEPTG